MLNRLARRSFLSAVIRSVPNIDKTFETSLKDREVNAGGSAGVDLLARLVSLFACQG